MGVLLLTAGPGAAFAGGAASLRSSSPIRVVAQTRIDPRLLELTLHTPALRGNTKVRVLLPDGYARARHRRYPVLYLLHGAAGSYSNWTRFGRAEQLTAHMPLIVVMPDAGNGWYANWNNDGRGGPPEWETYHVDQLIPFVDHRFRTVAARRGRAIAGLSMGGFGALSYAARHPDLFTAAATFSGGVDLELRLYGQPAGEIAVDTTAVRDGGHKGSIFGDFATQDILWRGHNPPDLAVNLRGLALGIYSGNGQPGGPFGPSTFDLIEFGAHAMSANLHRRLERLGIPHIWDDYGRGGHLFPYWTRDLSETLPWLLHRFSHPPRPPARITYTSIERSYSVYGWRVALRRPNVELSTLERAGRRGFAFSGSGRATVTTPASYRPRARYRMRVIGGGRTTTRQITASRAGRLRISLRLAPANRYDEYSPRARGRRLHRVTVSVSIAAVRRSALPRPPAHGRG